MAGMDLPCVQSVSRSLGVESRHPPGAHARRHLDRVTEVQGMEGDVIVMQDLFVFEQQGIEAGKVIGRLKPTGIRPKFVEVLEAANIHLPPTIVGVGRHF